MKKKALIGAVVSGVTLLSVVASINHPPAHTNNQKTTPTVTTPAPKPITIPTCNGTTVTTDCKIGKIKYITYIYHGAVPKKTHTEQVTTYEKKVIGYCTLCQDGTYSPSCATGRGACSYHGGVAQWNAPEYSSVPVYTTKTIVDAPAQAAYYEKVKSDL